MKITVHGVDWKAWLKNFPEPHPKQTALLSVDGHVIVSGELHSVQFIEGGIAILFKPEPTSIPSAGVPRRDKL